MGYNWLVCRLYRKERTHNKGIFFSSSCFFFNDIFIRYLHVLTSVYIVTSSWLLHYFAKGVLFLINYKQKKYIFFICITLYLHVHVYKLLHCYRQGFTL